VADYEVPFIVGVDYSKIRSAMESSADGTVSPIFLAAVLFTVN